MRITLESDYALRIVSELAKRSSVVDAQTLSSATSVTPRFTLKILSKLVGGGIVSSYKGAKGGYKLKEDADKITLKRVIELIDGPIVIARCLETHEKCTLTDDKTSCIYHHIFDKISFDLSVKLDSITISDVLNKKYTV